MKGNFPPRKTKKKEQEKKKSNKREKKKKIGKKKKIVPRHALSSESPSFSLSLVLPGRIPPSLSPPLPLLSPIGTVHTGGTLTPS